MNSEALQWAQKGVEAQEKRDLQGALVAYQKAVALEVTIPGLVSNLGVVLTDLSDYEKAEGVFLEAIRVDGSNPAVWNNRGNLWKKKKEWARALDDYTKALELQSDYVTALFNRGTVYGALDQLEDAERDLRSALQLQPNLAKAWVNLGEVLWEQSRLNEVLSCFEKAIACDEENPEAHWNRALFWLWSGDYQKGWPEYEWRWALPGVLEFHPEIQEWRGENQVDLLVHAEQGFGDTIQFSRYLLPLKERVRSLTVEVQPALLKCLREFYPEVTFVTPGECKKMFSHKIALQSLPLVLELEKPIAGASPRLSPRSAGARKIGFCWSGSDVDLRRRCSLELWNPLFELPDCQWVSFQTGKIVSELQKTSYTLENWGNHFQDFHQTAEALKKVDLVVTIDTALAHLAGTMGIPTFVLLPHVADWRWGREGKNSDWYPSVTCFRQKTKGDWGSVMEAVKAALLKR